MLTFFLCSLNIRILNAQELEAIEPCGRLCADIPSSGSGGSNTAIAHGTLAFTDDQDGETDFLLSSLSHVSRLHVNPFRVQLVNESAKGMLRCKNLYSMLAFGSLVKNVSCARIKPFHKAVVCNILQSLSICSHITPSSIILSINVGFRWFVTATRIL